MTARTKTDWRSRRRARGRAKLSGTAARPRLAVFRSNKYIYAQLINDAAGATLAAADGRELKAKPAFAGAIQPGKRASDVGFSKVPEAYAVGRLLAGKALAKKIKQVCFDRGGYLYAGRVRALAEGARDGGLVF